MNKLDYLESHLLLQDLEAETLNALAKGAQWFLLDAGETLLTQGEQGDAVYWLHTGCISIVRDGQTRGYINESKIIGEIALLGEQANAATLIAERDCLLLKAGHQLIHNLMQQDVRLMQQLVQPAIRRLSGQVDAAGESSPCCYVVVMPLQDNKALMRDFASELARQLPQGQFVDADEVNRQLDVDVRQVLTEEEAIKVMCWLRALENDTTFLVLVTDSDDNPWTRRCLRQAERILLITDKGTDPGLYPLEKLLWGKTGYAEGRGVDLALYRSEVVEQTAASIDWLIPRKIRSFIELVNFSSDSMRKLATRLQQPPPMIQYLSTNPLFADISEDKLLVVAGYFNERVIPAGEMLCEHGTVSDSMYLVESGRFVVFRGEQMLGELEPGEVVGEVGMIAGTPRAASVRAERDSLVLELTQQNFERLLAEIPELLPRLATILGKRLEGAGTQSPESGMVITLLPLDDSPSFQERFRGLCQQLQQTLQHFGDCTVISAERIEQELGGGVANLEPTEKGAMLLSAWINEQERRHPFILLIGDPEDTIWTRRCQRQSDRVLLVDVPDRGSELSSLERALQDELQVLEPLPELVLIQPAKATQGRNTIDWLKLRKLHRHHHVRENNRDDTARLARMVTGRAIGLVMSGVSSRAIAHVGVIRALQEQNIPVDCVTGTSSGAGIAAMLSLGLPWQEIDAHTRALTRSAADMKPSRFTLPYASLMNGFDATEALHREIGADYQQEDQFITFIATATDLRSSNLVKLTQGPVWQSVRASGSLPVVWPPVAINDQVLVDGGLLDNVPTQVLTNICRHGCIMVSNPNSSFTPFEKIVNYGTGLSGWKVLMHKLRGGEGGLYPSLLDTVTHAMCMESYRQQTVTDAMQEDKHMIFFNVAIPSDGMFSVSSDEMMDELTDLTYNDTLRVLGEYSDRLGL